MSLTKLSLGGNNFIIPAQGELSKWHPRLGTGMSPTFFGVWSPMSRSRASHLPQDKPFGLSDQASRSGGEMAGHFQQPVRGIPARQQGMPSGHHVRHPQTSFIQGPWGMGRILTASGIVKFIIFRSVDCSESMIILTLKFDKSKCFESLKHYGKVQNSACCAESHCILSPYF